jgi:hypothetical protein
MRPLLYQRDLPGGGYVAIDALASGDGRWHARLWVERRPDPARRTGHPPPIVLEADDADLEAGRGPTPIGGGRQRRPRSGAAPPAGRLGAERAPGRHGEPGH